MTEEQSSYLQDEGLRRRYEAEESRKRNRFMGWVLVASMLLFILPAYNLVASYQNIGERQQEIKNLEKDYKELSQDTKTQQELARRLKDDAYVLKYARAKYYLSHEGEVVYPLPDLVPK